MYSASENRYSSMAYNRLGTSGLKLPAVSLGLWHNFGNIGSFQNMREMCLTAFDHGITHFDLANNYGPPEGTAELNFGRILKEDLGVYRDELIISTTSGYWMWPGPYGEWSSRKQLLASLDQSLKRLGVDYVDIFYHHRPDPDTPLEETMGALASAVQSGKALYVGLSNYDGKRMEQAAAILRDLRVPFVINQNNYSIFQRYRELRVYREGEKQLAIRLRLTYPETWAIDLFRPKAVAYVIGWYEGSRRKTWNVCSLQEEPALFQGLLDLFFTPAEQEEREQFLKRIGRLGTAPYNDCYL